MNVNVVSTIDDHRQEVIAYCRENNFHGIVADDAEYIVFDPPRLFSACQLKLTFHVKLIWINLIYLSHHIFVYFLNIISYYCLFNIFIGNFRNKGICDLRINERIRLK